MPKGAVLTNYTSSCGRAMVVAIENKADKAQKRQFQWQT